MNLGSMSLLRLISHFHVNAPPLLNPRKADKYLAINNNFENIISDYIKSGRLRQVKNYKKRP